MSSTRIVNDKVAPVNLSKSTVHEGVQVTVEYRNKTHNGYSTGHPREVVLSSNRKAVLCYSSRLVYSSRQESPYYHIR